MSLRGEAWSPGRLRKPRLRSTRTITITLSLGQLRRGAAGAVVVGLPLMLASSLDTGAAAEAAPPPPAGTASVHPDAQWLQGLTGSVLTDRAAVSPGPLGPGTAVTPVGGDPQVLVLAGPVAGTQTSGQTSVPGGGTAATAGLTSSGIPVRVLRGYVAAAQVMAGRAPGCHLSWSLLAGIGRVESNHGRFGGAVVGADGRVSPPIYGPLLDGSGGYPAIADTDGGRWDGNAQFDRAVGPMQFIPGTWAIYGADGNGDGVADPQNVDDAALAAARYLCAGGGDLSTQAGRWNAVYRYNHSASYVSLVLGLADSYASGTPTALPAQPPGVTTPAGPPASVGKPAAVVPPPAPGSTPAKTPAKTPVSTAPSGRAPGTTPGSKASPGAVPVTTPPTTPATTPVTTPPTTPATTPVTTPPTTPASTPTDTATTSAPAPTPTDTATAPAATTTPAATTPAAPTATTTASPTT